ncbi:MAG: exo-alpha-sialidase [Caldilineaceae bacterium]|nr:exo-alpha-sialidase [Caldilineaceae bacterium]
MIRVLSLFVGLTLLAALPATGLAQARLDWMPQQPIPDYAVGVLPPMLVADQNRTVHAFVTQPLDTDEEPGPDSNFAILYRQWTLDGGWTKPNDILLSPLKQQARVKGVFLDPAGIMHLIFYGGDEQDAYLYYSWVLAANAGNAHAWAEPLPIGPKPITPDVAQIAGDGEGNLAVVYSGNLGEGNSLYALYSYDHGITWSEPAPIFSTYRLDQKVFNFALSLGKSGILHMVWNVTDRDGRSVAGYYAQLSTLNGGSWSTPFVLDTPYGLGVSTPAIIEHGDQVILVYNNGLPEPVTAEGSYTPPVLWYRISYDLGQRWTNPFRPFNQHIGINGTLSLVEDGDGQLYLFFGQRIPKDNTGGFDTHGMWYSSWLGNQWSAAQPVVSGPQKPDFDPYDARAAVAQGNVILLTWRTDPGNRGSFTWFSVARVDAAETPIVPLPTSARPAIAIQPTPVPVVTSSPPEAELIASNIQPVTRQFSRSRDTYVSFSSGPAFGLLAGVVPVVLVLVAIGGLALLLRTKRGILDLPEDRAPEIAYDEEAGRRSNWWVLGGLLVLGALMRLFALVAPDWAATSLAVMAPEAAATSYVQLARSLLQSDFVAFQGVSPTALQAPGYPLLLAASQLLSHSWYPVQVVQILADLVLIWVAYSLTMHLSQRTVIATLVGLALTFNPQLITASITLLPDTLSICLVAIAIFLLIVRRDRRSTNLWLPLILSLAVYLRPALLSVVVLMLVALLLHRILRGHGWRQRLLWPLTTVLIFGLLFVSWVLLMNGNIVADWKATWAQAISGDLVPSLPAHAFRIFWPGAADSSSTLAIPTSVLTVTLLVLALCYLFVVLGAMYLMRNRNWWSVIVIATVPLGLLVPAAAALSVDRAALFAYPALAVLAGVGVRWVSQLIWHEEERWHVA